MTTPISRRALGTPGLGRDQRRWIQRILSGGGVVEVREITQVRSFLVMPDGTEVQVPIRVFESLVERGLFEPGDPTSWLSSMEMNWERRSRPTLRYRYRPDAPTHDTPTHGG